MVDCVHEIIVWEDGSSQGSDAGHTDCGSPSLKRRRLPDGLGFPTNPMAEKDAEIVALKAEIDLLKAHAAGASTFDASTSTAVVGLGFKGLKPPLQPYRFRV